MQSAVNRQHGLNNVNKKPQTEDELLESLENIDMLLANMRAGDSQREDAIQRLGDKFDVFGEQNAKQRLRDDDSDSRPT